MNRIQILGPCGSGKSTLSRQIGAILNLPVYHMDQLYWQPNWTPSSESEIKDKVSEVIQKPKWIIEGNYTSTLQSRINRSDSIIYIDVPTWKCFYRVIKRYYKYRGRSRPDMNEGCLERLDFEFLHFVLVWNFLKRKRMFQKLKDCEDTHHITVLKGDSEIASFLKELQHSQN